MVKGGIGYFLDMAKGSDNKTLIITPFGWKITFLFSSLADGCTYSDSL